MEAILESARPDDFQGKLPAQIPTATLRALSVRSSARAITHIAGEWIAILAAAWLCFTYWHWWAYVLAVMFIAGRQHALAVLMHDGSHFLLTNNKEVNDWISDIFLAWPVFITTATYRSNHWEHHRYVNTERDPDCMRTILYWEKDEWVFPTSWAHFSLMFLKDVTSISFFQMAKSLLFLIKGDLRGPQGTSARVRKVARLVFYAGVVAASIVFGFWKGLLLFWIVPYLTAFNLFLRIRAIAEHFGTENDNPLNITRTTLAAWYEKPFFPKNVNYHLDHHLYPSVPFYRLPELHRVLMEQPAFRSNAHITQTYFGVLRECVTLPPPKRSCLGLPKTSAS